MIILYTYNPSLNVKAPILHQDLGLGPKICQTRSPSQYPFDINTGNSKYNSTSNDSVNGIHSHIILMQNMNDDNGNT